MIHKPILLAAIAVMMTSLRMMASDATFSRDSSHVYLIRYFDYDQTMAPAGLVDVDLTTKSCRRINLDPAVGAPIEGMTLSNAGFIVFATKNAVWSYDPAKAAWAKVCDAPTGIILDDIAYDPKTEDILATGSPAQSDSDTGHWAAYLLPKGGGKWINVSARYGTVVGHPVFAADGTLFFAFYGDLWSGVVLADEGTLVAARCVPLGFLIDENTSPASSGVREIAVGKDLIYTNYGRLGGSGWGSLIRVRRPPPLAKEDDAGWGVSIDALTWKQRQAELASVEVVNDSMSGYLCAARDGSLVAFTSSSGDSDELFLFRHDGKPESIKIKGLADALK